MKNIRKRKKKDEVKKKIETKSYNQQKLTGNQEGRVRAAVKDLRKTESMVILGEGEIKTRRKSKARRSVITGSSSRIKNIIKKGEGETQVRLAIAREKENKVSK